MRYIKKNLKNMKKFIFLLAVVSAVWSCTNNNTSTIAQEQDTTKIAQSSDSNNHDIYDNFGVIKIKDPFATHIGYPADSADVFFISLRDVGKYHGKVCPGIATGFKMIKDVLDSLFPNEIPQRGLIKVACSRGSDLLDVAGFITGARGDAGRSEINRGDLVIDTTLNPHIPKAFAMVFARKDNGKMYKVIFHKDKLLSPDDKEFIFSVDKKALAGELDSTTEAKFRKTVQNEVRRTLTEGPRKGVYTIRKCVSYKFDR